jgi:hypothetical protein
MEFNWPGNFGAASFLLDATFRQDFCITFFKVSSASRDAIFGLIPTQSKCIFELQHNTSLQCTVKMTRNNFENSKIAR